MMTDVAIGDVILYQVPEFADTSFGHIPCPGTVKTIEDGGVWAAIIFGIQQFVPWRDIVEVKNKTTRRAGRSVLLRIGVKKARLLLYLCLLASV